MARSLLCGPGLGSIGEFFATTGTSPTIQNTTTRPGGSPFAIRTNPSAAQSYVQFRRRVTAGSFAQLFFSCRFYMRAATLPSANTHILECFSTSISAVHQFLQLNTDGTLSVGSNATVQATSTDTIIADGLFHLVEFDAITATGMTVYVDGVQFATTAGGTTAVDAEGRLGVITSTTADLYFSDIEWWNTTIGGASLYATHKHKIVLAVPTADGSTTAWTEGAGGTGALWDAVNNIPPAGLSAETNTSQIKSISSTGTAQYTATMQSYSALGIGPSDIIDAVMPIINHGEEVATGTKSGSLQTLTNPIGSTTNNTFDFGDDVGALGTFPTNWKTFPGPVDDTPTITISTAPTVKVIKTDTTTREADVDFIGLYISFTPAPKSLIADGSRRNLAHRHHTMDRW